MEQITRRQFLKRIFAYGSIGLIASYPVFIERNIVRINKYRIPVPNLPKKFFGFRVVHLTDFHYGPLVSLKYIRNVVERANRFNPDLIVCTGDYVHGKNSTLNIKNLLLIKIDSVIMLYIN